MNFGSSYGSKYTSRGGLSFSATPASFTQTVGWAGIKARRPKLNIAS